VDLLAEDKGCEVFVKYLPSLEKEYAFWMSGRTELEGNDSEVAINHVVRLGDGDFLNRYFDQHHQPRIEMYATDLEFAKKTHRPADDLFSDIRAACESGWDFSSRWLRHANDLTTIHTTEILPVDLNCLLYYLEITIAKGHATQGNTSSFERFDFLSKRRKALILEYLWNESTGYFHDYDFVRKDQTEVLTLAGMFPLFFKLANTEQANNCAEIVKNYFLKAGGLVTSLTHSGQQWDAPNGWAPLQWIGVQGLRNYGFYELANESSNNWKQLNTDIYHRTGKLLEKYNVEDTKLVGGGGEYEVQDGFGWTNGVLLKLLSDK
jgi:alpha,alpha-trehalase